MRRGKWKRLGMRFNGSSCQPRSSTAEARRSSRSAFETNRYKGNYDPRGPTTPGPPPSARATGAWSVWANLERRRERGVHGPPTPSAARDHASSVRRAGRIGAPAPHPSVFPAQAGTQPRRLQHRPTQPRPTRRPKGVVAHRWRSPSHPVFVAKNPIPTPGPPRPRGRRELGWERGVHGPPTPGSESWTKPIAEKLGLQATLRPRGRPGRSNRAES